MVKYRSTPFRPSGSSLVSSPVSSSSSSRLQPLKRPVFKTPRNTSKSAKNIILTTDNTNNAAEASVSPVSAPVHPAGIWGFWSRFKAELATAFNPPYPEQPQNQSQTTSGDSPAHKLEAELRVLRRRVTMLESRLEFLEKREGHRMARRRARIASERGQEQCEELKQAMAREQPIVQPEIPVAPPLTPAKLFSAEQENSKTVEKRDRKQSNQQREEELSVACSKEFSLSEALEESRMRLRPVKADLSSPVSPGSFLLQALQSKFHLARQSPMTPDTARTDGTWAI